ncbi:MAG: PAS domain S-box protein, partial [Desulfobacula sp.]|nr:PAS domain S-box protein [Desulfobacula sp.]
EFEYAGLEYSQPHLNQYKYKLEGLDPDWVDAGNRRYGRYTGLPGGTYDLKVIGSNNEGFWNNEGITIKITVDKPFWKTWYFYNAIIAVTIILFLMIIFYVARLLKEIKVRKITENALFISREDLRKTNKFLEAVVKQAPFGIEVLKINEDKWDMLLVNKEACNIKLQPDLSKYRTGKKELHSWKILDPDNQPFIFTKSSVIDSIRNRNFTKLDELQIVRKDNSRRWITYNVSPILDGQSKVVGGLIIYSDITHRKQAENKTRRVKNQLREIINMMPSVLIGIDHQHNITHWNHHAASMTSLTEDTVVGKSFFSQFPGSKDLLNIIENTIKNKKVLQLDKMLTSINEQTRHINLTVYPFGLNEIDRFVIKMDDITQHVKMEEIVIQNEKMMMIGGLAAGMAHEINNPLSAIMQGAQNIGRRLSPDMAANREIA